MSIFPTQYSRLSSAALGDYVAAAYGLPIQSCELLISNVSDTYRLQSGDDKYILKVYRPAHRSVDEARGEAALLNALVDGGISVARPIADKQGNFVQTFEAVEGIKSGVLFSFAPGRPYFPLSERRLKVLGAEIAAMHHITSSLTLPFPRPVYDIGTTLITPLETIKKLFRDMQEEYAFLQDTVAKTIEKLESFDTSRFGYGYCHYDLIPKNYHFTEDDRITIYDFDFAGKGYLVNDLMTFYIQLAFVVNDGRVTQDQANADFRILTDAYREVRPVSDEELAAIPYLGVAFWIYFLKFYVDHFDDWSNTFLTPHFVKERVALIRKWVEWYCRF